MQRNKALLHNRASGAKNAAIPKGQRTLPDF
jgi:hypothetical protein